MKLYIFKCRARPRMYGATRYETASNLPIGECSGWEFFERIDLTPEGRLRYAVNTATVRRYIEQRGWHVWDESPLDSRKKEIESPRVPSQQRQPPAEPKTAVSAEPPEYSRKEVAESTPLPAPQQQPSNEFETIASEELAAFRRKEAARNAPLPPQQQPPPAVKPETVPLEEWAATSRKKEVETARALLQQQQQQRVQPEAIVAEKPPEHRRREEAQSTPSTRQQQPPPAVPRTDTPGVAPAPANKTVLRTTTDVLPSRPAQTVKPNKVETPITMPTLATRHRVVWFDIPVRDIDRAVRFYSAVLGIPLKKEQAGPGAAIVVLPHAEGSIGGSLVQNLDAKPSEGGPLIYLNTHGRLDEALNAVEKHGGRVLAQRHSIAPFGFRAIVLDSEGNRIALHST